MKEVLYYLQTVRKQIVVFLLFCGIFVLVFALCRLPLATVAYGGGICGFFGLLILAGSYRDWKKRRERLWAVKRELEVGLDALPKPLLSKYAAFVRRLSSLRAHSYGCHIPALALPQILLPWHGRLPV